MRVLLDTHILLWALTEDPKLPEDAQKIISDVNNEIFYSSASIWEVAIKHMNHPDSMPVSAKELSDYCKGAGYEMLPVIDEHVFSLETLFRAKKAPRHNDPFDRIMIAQAKTEELQFITHDALLPYYNEECIMWV